MQMWCRMVPPTAIHGRKYEWDEGNEWRLKNQLFDKYNDNDTDTMFTSLGEFDVNYFIAWISCYLEPHDFATSLFSGGKLFL